MRGKNKHCFDQELKMALKKKLKKKRKRVAHVVVFVFVGKSYSSLPRVNLFANKKL